MMLLGDKYAIYVIVSYAAAGLLLAGLIWSTLAAAARSRRDLGEVDREGRE